MPPALPCPPGAAAAVRAVCRPPQRQGLGQAGHEVGAQPALGCRRACARPCHCDPCWGGEKLRVIAATAPPRHQPAAPAAGASRPFARRSAVSPMLPLRPPPNTHMHAITPLRPRPRHPTTLPHTFAALPAAWPRYVCDPSARLVHGPDATRLNADSDQVAAWFRQQGPPADGEPPGSWPWLRGRLRSRGQVGIWRVVGGRCTCEVAGCTAICQPASSPAAAPSCDSHSDLVPPVLYRRQVPLHLRVLLHGGEGSAAGPEERWGPSLLQIRFRTNEMSTSAVQTCASYPIPLLHHLTPPPGCTASPPPPRSASASAPGLDSYQMIARHARHYEEDLAAMQRWVLVAVLLQYIGSTLALRLRGWSCCWPAALPCQSRPRQLHASPLPRRRRSLGWCLQGPLGRHASGSGHGTARRMAQMRRDEPGGAAAGAVPYRRLHCRYPAAACRSGQLRWASQPARSGPGPGACASFLSPSLPAHPGCWRCLPPVPPPPSSLSQDQALLTEALAFYRWAPCVPQSASSCCLCCVHARARCGAPHPPATYPTFPPCPRTPAHPSPACRLSAAYMLRLASPTAAAGGPPTLPLPEPPAPAFCVLPVRAVPAPLCWSACRACPAVFGLPAAPALLCLVCLPCLPCFVRPAVQQLQLTWRRRLSFVLAPAPPCPPAPSGSLQFLLSFLVLSSHRRRSTMPRTLGRCCCG